MIELIRNIEAKLGSPDANWKASAAECIQSVQAYQQIYPEDHEMTRVADALKVLSEEEDRFRTAEDKRLFEADCKDIFDAVRVYTSFMLSCPEDSPAADIEKRLFRMIFNVNRDGTTTVYPVYRMHDTFIKTSSQVANFKSSTGSGKTRCVPFIFPIRAILEDMKYPFTIMTQPNMTIIRDKLVDFRELLGDTVIFVTGIKELEEMYRNIPDKPVVALMTPHNALKLLARADKRRLDIAKYTRFVLDEIHERSVDTDVLVALIAERLKKNKFPLQLLMMSATPDPRIIDLFDAVEMLELPDALLFPIQDVPLEVKGYDEINKLARDQALDVVTKFATGEVEPGHILIFTSGNKRISTIMNMLNTTIEHHCKDKGRPVRLLKDMTPYLVSQDIFYDHLDAVLAQDEDADTALYILVIKFAGFVSQEARDIGKNPIPNHPNVLKIIVATNSIESSITIDGLAAVIDTGIYNEASFDKHRGITTLNEAPISKQSQIQRRGRVGRKRPGISVQITIKDHPPIDLRPPALTTEDISSNILNLRQIGIKLEEIKNIPAPGVPQHEMREYMDQLISIGAIDPSTYELTATGCSLGNFSCISPFVSASIMKVAANYKDETAAMILATLAFLIMTTDNLCANPRTEALRKNFCEESDVITLMTSCLEIITSRNARKALSEYGLSQGFGVKLLGSLRQVAQNLYYEDDANVPWDEIIKFYKETDNMTLINDLLKEINNVRPEWTECRRATFVTVSNVMTDHKLIYNDKENKEFTVSARPGGKGYATPGSSWILQIKYAPDGVRYGAIVHRDTTREDVPHPLVEEVPIYMSSPFVQPLIEAYLGDNRKAYLKLQKGMYKKDDHYGVLCYPDQYGDSVILSYIPAKLQDRNAEEQMKEAIKMTEKLIPYTPRTILVNNNVIKAVMAVTSAHDNNYTTRVWLYDEKSPIAYKIDSVTMKYLVDHIAELNNPDGHLTVAMTGEKFAFTDMNIDNSNNMPVTGQQQVFGTKDYMCSHMVVISNSEIPKATRVPWVGRDISMTYSKDDIHAFMANQMFRGVVNVTHSHNTIFVFERGASLTENIRVETDAAGHRMYLHSLFSHLAARHVDDGRLTSDVSIKDFRFTSRTDFAQATFPRLKRDDKRDIRKVIEGLNNLGVTTSDLAAMRTARANMDALNSEYKTAKYARKKQIEQLHRQYKASVRNYDAISAIMKDNQVHIEHLETLTRFMGLYSAITKGKWVPNVVGANDHASVGVPVDECHQTLANLRRTGNFDCDVVPQYTVEIMHTKTGSLNKDDFVANINRLCDRFGCVVQSKREYKEIEKNRTYHGSMSVVLSSAQFIIPFVNEIENVAGIGNNVVFEIPQNILPANLANNKKVIDSIDDWIEANNIHIMRKGTRYFGKREDVANATEMMVSTYKPPFKTVRLPQGVELASAVRSVKRQNNAGGEKWYLDRGARQIWIPVEIEEEDALAALRLSDKRKQAEGDGDEHVILYDGYYWCGEEDAVLSALQIPLYHTDGSISMHNFCVTCAYELFKTEVNRYIKDDGTVRLSLLAENSEPIRPIDMGCEDCFVPLGQALWALVADPVMITVIKTWLTAIINSAIHASSHFDHCPQHPGRPIRIVKGDTVKCMDPKCGRYVCRNCNNWHKDGECKALVNEVPPGMRRCPHCRRIIEKSSACNHISCTCGKHFCYHCGFGPKNNGDDIYAHMGPAGHWNEAPDYMKYCRGDTSITQAQIDDFYVKYPQWNPKNSG